MCSKIRCGVTIPGQENNVVIDSICSIGEVGESREKINLSQTNVVGAIEFYWHKDVCIVGGD